MRAQGPAWGQNIAHHPIPFEITFFALCAKKRNGLRRKIRQLGESPPRLHNPRANAEDHFYLTRLLS